MKYAFCIPIYNTISGRLLPQFLNLQEWCLDLDGKIFTVVGRTHADARNYLCTDGGGFSNPNKLIDNAKTIKKIAGKKVIHHSPENKKLFPNLIRVPREGVVGGTPTPKKLKVDSVIIASANPIVAITNIGRSIFGKICLNIINIFDNPIILEAETYSLFFSTKVDALDTLAN